MSRGLRPPVKTRAQARFLGILRATGSVSKAARAADVSRRVAYGWRKHDPTFRELWDEAMEHAVDLLEETAWTRAVDGVERPVFYRGERIGTERSYSDRMLELLLKAHRTDRFRERATPSPDRPRGPDAVMRVLRSLDQTRFGER